eukprot:COSAG06_NODE_9870_length_1800_cov_1.761317_1_plen_51_part_00
MSEKDAGYDKSLDRDSVIIEGWLMKKNQKGVEWWKKRYVKISPLQRESPP